MDEEVTALKQTCIVHGGSLRAVPARFKRFRFEFCHSKREISACF